MAQPDTISIPELREYASDLRRRANEIDRHIDALLSVARLAGMSFSVPAAAATPPEPSPHAGDVEPDKAEQVANADNRTSRHGIVTGKWMMVLRVLAQTAGGEAFPVSMAIDAVKQEHERDTRAADIRRQFKPYLDAGYLKRAGADEYRFTAKGFAKVGHTGGNGMQEQSAPDENGPPSTAFDDILGGPDTALDAQDRRPPE